MFIIPDWLIYAIVGGGQGFGCLSIVLWALHTISKDEEKITRK